MAADFQVLQAMNDMDGEQNGAMRVLPHPFHTPMSLQQLWVAICSLGSASSGRFIALAEVLRVKMAIDFQPLQANTHMDAWQRHILSIPQ